MAATPFFGTVDQKTARLGPAFAQAVRRAQVATWAAAAEAEHGARRSELRREHSDSHSRVQRFALPNEGWWAIPGARQQKFLAGAQRPHRRTIDDVAKHSPSSRKTFFSPLWRVLCPQGHLGECRVTVAMFDESKLDALIDGLLSGHALDWTEQLADLTATSALVAHIHLLVHEGMPGRAFETGRALAQALCYHALNPLFSTKAADLWDVVSLGVLEGLCDGDFRFARGREGYRFVTDTLCERWRATKALYGIHRMISGPSFAWNTVVDLNRECIRGFTTPELELSELLQSFLDVGAPGLRASSPLDRDPLFVTKSAALTKKKMQF